MKKGIVSVAMALVFALSFAASSMAAATKCTVDSIDGDKVTMTCKSTDDMKAGDNVKVKVMKAGGAVEGC